jgi:hypothetical protein
VTAAAATPRRRPPAVIRLPIPEAAWRELRALVMQALGAGGSGS